MTGARRLRSASVRGRQGRSGGARAAARGEICWQKKTSFELTTTHTHSHIHTTQYTQAVPPPTVPRHRLYKIVDCGGMRLDELKSGGFRPLLNEVKHIRINHNIACDQRNAINSKTASRITASRTTRSKPVPSPGAPLPAVRAAPPVDPSLQRPSPAPSAFPPRAAHLRPPRRRRRAHL